MAHLAASLGKVQPTAIGLIPPPHLDTAIRDVHIMKSGVLPGRMMLMNIDKTLSNCLPPSPDSDPVISFRCSGRRPPGPPDEPLGLMDLATSSLNIFIAVFNSERTSRMGN